MFKGLVTALQTLTAIPITGKGADRFSSAVPWFPVVGALLGAILYLIALLYVCSPLQWPEGAAAVVLVVSVLLTRALHLDGLADCADGFGGSREREKTLAIMKDSSVGAFGAIALVLVLLVKWTAFSQLIDKSLEVWIVAAYVASRAMQAELAGRLPYARSEGGTAGPFVEGAGMAHRVSALLIAGILLLAVCGPLGLGALLLGWIAATWFGAFCRRRVGGITGDLLGAASEIVESLILFVSAAGAGWLAAFTGWKNIIVLCKGW